MGLAPWWARREDRNMSEKSPKELQTMIEELTKRLKVLEQQYVPNVEKRVARLEDDLRSLQRTVASGR
jgi:polyhydroxyalkanoate synthesis regulator phasin